MRATAAQYIESVPGRCGGKPVIAGTRIRVWDIYVSHELQGKSADEIIAAFPELSLAEVYAALSYYFEHKQEIDAQMKADDEFVEHLKKLSGLGPLARKLASMESNGQDH